MQALRPGIRLPVGSRKKRLAGAVVRKDTSGVTAGSFLRRESLLEPPVLPGSRETNSSRA